MCPLNVDLLSMNFDLETAEIRSVIVMPGSCKVYLYFESR